MAETETRTRTDPPQQTDRTQQTERSRWQTDDRAAGADKLMTVIDELRQAQDMLLAALRGWNDTAVATNRTLINDMITVSERWLAVQRRYFDTIANAQRSVNTRALRRFAWPDEE